MKKKFFVSTLCALFVVACMFVLTGCGSSSTSGSDSTSASTSSSTASSSSAAVSTSASNSASASSSSSQTAFEPTSSGKVTAKARVKVKGYDSFTIDLYGDDAPKTVKNFTTLAKEGFYDGLTFHRIVEGFCLQGGDPAATGTGGSDETVKGEFSDNDVNNVLADNFGRGIVAMARSNDPDSASSQFFITLDTSDSVSQSLDGNYAAFGFVNAKGMKIVDQIVSDYVDKASGTSGTITEKSDQPVIESITIKD